MMEVLKFRLHHVYASQTERTCATLMSLSDALGHSTADCLERLCLLLLWCVGIVELMYTE